MLQRNKRSKLFESIKCLRRMLNCLQRREALLHKSIERHFEKAKVHYNNNERPGVIYEMKRRQALVRQLDLKMKIEEQIDLFEKSTHNGGKKLTKLKQSAILMSNLEYGQSFAEHVLHVKDNNIIPLDQLFKTWIEETRHREQHEGRLYNEFVQLLNAERLDRMNAGLVVDHWLGIALNQKRISVVNFADLIVGYMWSPKKIRMVKSV